jgi:hypothetical protein
MDAFCAKSYLSKLKLEPIFCFMLQNLCSILYLTFPYLSQFSLDSFLKGCLILIPISPSQQVQITYLIFIIERIIASIRYESLEGLISLTPYLNLTLVRYSCLLCSYYPSPISSYHHYYFKPNMSLNSSVPLSQLRLYLSPKPVASAMFMLCLSSRSSPAKSKMLLKSPSSNCLTL